MTLFIQILKLFLLVPFLLFVSFLIRYLKKDSD